MYHSISKDTNPKFKQFTVSPELFAEHMAYLHQHRYTPITVTQYVSAQYHGGDSLPERPVILTFDDGFADFYTEAFPLLKQYDFKATLYVTTGYVEGTSTWLQREREMTRPMLTWNQLREISLSGIECGGHSHTHPQLDTLTQYEAEREIVQSKRILESQLGDKVSTFAYPFGYYTDSVRRQVQKAGYMSACAIKHAMSSETTDPFALARQMVRPETSVDILAGLLRGHNTLLLSTMYARARTPIWQVARRSSALATRRLQEKLFAR